MTWYRCANQGSTYSTQPGRHQGRLVEDLARELGGDVAKIDPHIAFLTLDRDVRTPFARTLRVEHSAPWHEKRFAQRLRELDVGAVDIRRRGLAGDVHQIRRRLKLAGKTRATIVITRVNESPGPHLHRPGITQPGQRSHRRSRMPRT